MSKKFRNKDLAAKLGVSGTLVSLVLNNKADLHGISKETQERVLMMARQMGYFNYMAEKNLVAPVEESPGVIGMVVTSACDFFTTGITPYLQQAFSGIGMGFSIITKDPDDQRFDRMINAFRKFYSGLILMSTAADESTVRALRSSDYPFMLLENNNMQGRINSVYTDTAAGASLISRHIQKLGYKNILIVTDKSLNKANRVQTGQMEDELAQIHGTMKPVTLELDKSATSEEYNFMQFETFLRPPFRADIIITMQAQLVYPVMGLLRKKKLRVPQDVALISAEEGIGFDIMYSPVTCLRKPFPSMATKVANMVWSEIKNSGKGKFKRQVSTVPELIIRNSCGTL
ncbi:MAG: LacI family DNA-binding transcriptional regulator [Bacteroidia bacterium]|nr:LacI family DNA-binding transcriptional regulator [Bacteroidia bacterium]